MNNKVIESNTKKIAVDKDSANIVDIISKILDEMNERAERCKNMILNIEVSVSTIQNIRLMFSFANIVRKW
jgi:hypothetical protein